MGGKIKTTWQSAINAKRDCFRYVSQPRALESTKCSCAGLRVVLLLVTVCIRTMCTDARWLLYLFVNYFHIDEVSLFADWQCTHSLVRSLSRPFSVWPFHFNIILFCEAHKSSLSFLISCWRKKRSVGSERRTHREPLCAWMGFIV